MTKKRIILAKTINVIDKFQICVKIEANGCLFVHKSGIAWKILRAYAAGHLRVGGRSGSAAPFTLECDFGASCIRGAAFL